MSLSADRIEAMRRRVHGFTGTAPRGKAPRVRGAHDGVPEILIYDVIDEWFGVAPTKVKEALDAIDAPKIRVRINSPGGYVFDGMAIMNLLRAHQADIEVQVDGLAASAASAIAMAGDEIVMQDGAFMMIHRAWALTIGNANDMREFADVLDKIDGELAQLYARRAGVERAQAIAWMDAETWFTAGEAVDAGLADRTAEDAEDDATAAAAVFDLSIFAHVPQRLAAARPAPRNSGEMPDARTLEAALREAGCSRNQARHVLAGGYPGEGQCEAGAVELLRSVQQSAEAFRAN